MFDWDANLRGTPDDGIGNNAGARFNVQHGVLKRSGKETMIQLT